MSSMEHTEGRVRLKMQVYSQSEGAGMVQTVRSRCLGATSVTTPSTGTFQLFLMALNLGRTLTLTSTQRPWMRKILILPQAEDGSKQRKDKVPLLEYLSFEI